MSVIEGFVTCYQPKSWSFWGSCLPYCQDKINFCYACNIITTVLRLRNCITFLLLVINQNVDLRISKYMNHH